MILGVLISTIILVIVAWLFLKFHFDDWFALTVLVFTWAITSAVFAYLMGYGLPFKKRKLG
jgi:Mg/Co/Ni transporter MgtE